MPGDDRCPGIDDRASPIPMAVESSTRPGGYSFGRTDATVTCSKGYLFSQGHLQ